MHFSRDWERVLASIVLAADGHHLSSVSCTLAQLGRFGRSAEAVTVLVPASVPDSDLARIRAVASAHDVGLDVVVVPDLGFGHRRLRLAEHLGHLDDVLYLDVNVLICAPLDQLLGWELRHPLAAVPELGGNGLPLFGAAKVPYFNARVLRMSLERLRREQVWNQALEVALVRPRLRSQDVLNLLFADRFDSLPIAFNVPESYIDRYPELATMQDPVIVRFDGPTKPWHGPARTPLAREWRRQCAAAWRLSGDGIDGADATPLISGPSAQRAGISDLARAVLPPRVKQSLKSAPVRALDRAVCQLDELRTTIKAGRPLLPARLPATNSPRQSRDRSADVVEDQGLDLLVSIPRSGTTALGKALSVANPDADYFNEVYQGQSEFVGAEDIAARFPWFADGDFTKRRNLTPAERALAWRAFVATMSQNAVAFTHALLAGRQGRSLIKIFPGHLHRGAFEELLHVFRPRLLFLRRDNIFTYVSRIRAFSTRSFVHSDSTDVPYAIDNWEAGKYILDRDEWFDRVAHLAQELQLHCAAVTYDGLFTTGDDVPVLNSFYPGVSLLTDPMSGRLRVDLTVQDRRTDTSVREMITAVNALSPATQAGLLRLPGKSVWWQ